MGQYWNMDRIILHFNVIPEENKRGFEELSRIQQFLERTMKISTCPPQAKELYEKTLKDKMSLLDIREIERSREEFPEDDEECDIEIYNLCSPFYSEKEFEAMSSKAV